MIGLAVACEIFVLGPLTGGAINPARTFGPYVANSLFGGITPWAEFGVYIVGPVIGAVAAVVVYDQVVQPVSEVSEIAEIAEQGTASEINREPSTARPRRGGHRWYRSIK
jgi:glycerol uptake facilitator protein